jgi:hydroxylamine reductase
MPRDNEECGCSMKQGMCGKTAEVANLQDLFIWCFKGISFWGHKVKELDIHIDKAGFFIDKGLFATITNANFDSSFFINSVKESLKIREELKACWNV